MKRSERRWRETVAIHEAAHAVIGLHCGMKFRYVTVRPRDGSAGHIRLIGGLSSQHDGMERYALRRRAEPAILSTFAGDHAVKRLRGRRMLAEAGPDRRDAQDVASLVHNLGSEEFNAYLRYLWIWSEALVEKHWDHIELVSAELLGKETLSAEEVRELIWADIQRQIATTRRLQPQNT